jgi:signal transduction histidine kinase
MKDLLLITALTLAACVAVGLLGALLLRARTLTESRQRERAAEQSRQELVSFMSHDLRTLAGLRAHAEGLEDGVITDVPGTLRHFRNTVARMTIMVEDLFALSRAGCGGIPDAFLDRVFDTGWRGSPARGSTDGAGLGLAIARGVMKSHKGEIAVRNTGMGCRFEVAIPQAQPSVRA